MGKYSNKNAQAVLTEVEKLLVEAQACKQLGVRKPTFKMKNVYDRLSIFDWWVDELGVTRLKQMRDFLKLAIELGFTGYVCFKVGATGCANGMWAHTKESENGYSPKDCDTLYRSFTPAYTYYDMIDASGECLTKKVGLGYDNIQTANDLRRFVKEVVNA